jgi:hypothetical protein
MPRPTLRGRALLSSLLVWCTLFTPIQATLAAEPSTQILIGEIQWSGSSRSTADEWLEIWNIGTEPVSLAGWSLAGASDTPIFFTQTDSIAPQQTLLIANYTNTSDKTLLTTQTIALSTSTLSLPNDRLLIELRDQTGALRDSAGTGTKPPAGASTPINTSMIRTASMTGWIWRSATSVFSPSAPDLGTPGVCDECSSITLPAAENTLPAATSTVPVVTELPPLPEEAEEVPTTPTEVPVPAPEPPLLDPEEEVLYGVTPADLIEEQSDLPAPFPYESPALATSTSALPEVQETPDLPEVVSVTSTDEIIALESGTSTLVVTPTSTPVVTSTIEHVTSTIPSTDAISSIVVTAPPLSVTPAVAAPSSVPVPVPVLLDSAALDLVITEVMAAPAPGEEEWIELRLPENASPIRYIDWKLEADGKLIFSLTAPTIQALNPQGAYLLPAWKSAKLKNAGALIRLKRPDGTIAQEVRYGTSMKGTSWIRDDVSTTWKLTRRPTKNAPNVFEAATIAVPTPQTISAKTGTQPKSPTSTEQPAASSTPPESTGEVKTLGTATKSTSAKTSTSSAGKATERKTAPLKKTLVKKVGTAKPLTKKYQKASTKKSLVLPSSVTHFEQIPAEQLSPRVRVRLQGLVGSTVGVFGKQRFVLLAPDGRGLLVKATTAQPSPQLGETIEITGLLFANDEGVQLQMETGDTWKSVALTTTSSPRLVEWTAPGIEDQWSFTKLEGLVTDSRASAITLEAQIGEVTIPIKAILSYRAQRVKMGDTIEVSGIFDGRSGTWKIQPSKATDIVILRHPEPATKTAATSPSSTNLPWNAIGIALGSIGAVEGIRRWLEKRKAIQLLPKQPIPSTT